eukprot:SM000228S07386  [mRNA]  locus=s228:193448:194518:- [translate_table: standard]
MTITALHPISPKHASTVVTAAARSPYIRGPGLVCHTQSAAIILSFRASDNYTLGMKLGRLGENQSSQTSNSTVYQGSPGGPFQIEVDPIISDAWEAVGGAFEQQHRAFREGGAGLVKQMSESFERARKGFGNHSAGPSVQ